jgi:hypothetical protein
MRRDLHSERIWKWHDTMVRRAQRLHERWYQGRPHPGFRSMRTFDPSRPAMVHDDLNSEVFEWRPQWQAEYEEVKLDDLGVSNWDGRLLNGWRPLLQRGWRSRSRRSSS